MPPRCASFERRSRRHACDDNWLAMEPLSFEGPASPTGASVGDGDGVGALTPAFERLLGKRSFFENAEDSDATSPFSSSRVSSARLKIEMREREREQG